MTLRLLADHCISNFTVQSLRKANHEVLYLRDVLSVESADTVVIAKAQELAAILLSLNGDFADIVTYPPGNYRGIIALQLRNHPETLPQLLARLISFLNQHSDMAEYRGKLLVVEADRIRIRE